MRRDFLLHCVHPALRPLALDPSRPGLPSLSRAFDGERLFIFHINLTRQDVLPVDRSAIVAWLEARDVIVLNRDLADLGKRNLQEVLARAAIPCCRASRDGDPAEPLIVKSNNNCGDIGERALSEELAARLGVAGGAMPSGVRVQLLRRAEIPHAIWRGAALTVERYIHNDDAIFHRAYVLGKRLATAKARAPGVFKEMQQRLVTRHLYTRDHTRHAKDDSDPISVASRVCRALRLDFGAIDLMQDADGTIYPVDVNPTPFWGGEDRDSRLVQFLRRGWRGLADEAQPRTEPASSS